MLIIDVAYPRNKTCKCKQIGEGGYNWWCRNPYVVIGLYGPLIDGQWNRVVDGVPADSSDSCQIDGYTAHRGSESPWITGVSLFS